MSIKILGGIAKGLSLFVPKGNTIRPTSVMLKRRVFDSNQNLTSYTFIDSCAGSGSVGVEAWSRGAEEVILIEKSKLVHSILKKNIQIIEKKYSQELSNRPINYSLNSVEKWIIGFKEKYMAWSSEKKLNTIFFFDPPYNLKDLYISIVIDDLINGGWFKGEIWVESDRTKGHSIEFWEKSNVFCRKVYRQGTSYIAIIDCE